MYAAKRQGGNLAVVYNESLSDSARQDFDIEQQLTLALQQGRLALQFQPFVDAKSKRPVLAEALVRMRTEDGRLLGPGHKALPFDILKIDRAFVRDVEGTSLGASTLGAIIDIGKSLKLTIIAEGIETAEQALGLERLGCDLLQGFRFFKPMDPAAHAEVLTQGRAPLCTGRRAAPVGESVCLF